MLRAFVSALAVVALTGASAADPLSDFFNYEAPRLPVGGDCTAIAAEVGPQSTWYGEFAGNRRDNLNDRFYPFSARGCFRSEFDCRIWHQVAVTYLDGGVIVFARCERGAPGF